MLVGLVASLMLLGRAAPLPGAEYQLKAVFLFNFLQFVEWPPSAHLDKDSPIVIGIMGEDPFEGALEETIRGEKVRGRELVIRRFKPDDDPAACHLLFISRAAKDRAVGWVEKVQGRPVLTVSEFPGFAERGGVINLVMAGRKVRFEVNPRTAARQGLRVSSKLLQLAHVVDGKDGGTAP